MRIDELNREMLLGCCGSEAWASQMWANWPFRDAADLHEKAEAIWASLEAKDWLEAFSKHPKIGERASSKWSVQEQRGMSQAAPETVEAMRELNKRYESKFGWIFIVCATGKSADEMKALLDRRLLNDANEELRVAAVEQAKIMHLRLDKLLAE